LYVTEKESIESWPFGADTMWQLFIEIYKNKKQIKRGLYHARSVAFYKTFLTMFHRKTVGIIT
jgi:hypothetical protein